MLPEILAAKTAEVQQLKASTSEAALLDLAVQAPPCRPFYQALVSSNRPVSVIAEVKKASPSKGVIRPRFDPAAIARAYQAAGAEAVSVLTDRRFFQGSLDHLRQVRESVDLPLLRKDFLLDERQVLEARAAGADCVLLIAAVLDSSRLRALYQTAASLGMDVLVEVHDERELNAVFRSVTPRLIGINNRNLRTFVTDLATTERLAARIPKEVAVVSESGIATPEDISRVGRCGARAVLVGEHFMRQEDVRAAVIRLVGDASASRREGVR